MEKCCAIGTEGQSDEEAQEDAEVTLRPRRNRTKRHAVPARKSSNEDLHMRIALISPLPPHISPCLYSTHHGICGDSIPKLADQQDDLLLSSKLDAAAAQEQPRLRTHLRFQQITRAEEQ
jgi:hypothetical protein